MALNAYRRQRDPHGRCYESDANEVMGHFGEHGVLGYDVDKVQSPLPLYMPAPL